MGGEFVWGRGLMSGWGQVGVSGLLQYAVGVVGPP